MPENKRNLKVLDHMPENSQINDVHGLEVKDKREETIGRVQAVLMDEQQNQIRYVKINTEEAEHNNVILPVGLLRKKNNVLVTEDVDRDTVMHIPVQMDGEVITYKEELKIRSYFENPDKVDSHLSALDEDNYRTGAGPGHTYTDPETESNSDIDTNTRHQADVLQGEYKPNMKGGPEGIQERAINPEGKHDIPATSGNPEDTRRGEGASDADEITTDKPGATLGSDEQNSAERDQRISREKPDIPENANEDFYRHRMFDDSGLRG